VESMTSANSNSTSGSQSLKIKNRGLELKDIQWRDQCSSSSGAGQSDGALEPAPEAPAAAPPALLAPSEALPSETEPLAPLEGLPSRGSALHKVGRCRPCLLLYEAIGCTLGDQCSFCHSKHSKREIARISKGKRDRFSKLLAYKESGQNDQKDLRPSAGQPGCDRRPSASHSLAL